MATVLTLCSLVDAVGCELCGVIIFCSAVCIGVGGNGRFAGGMLLHGCWTQCCILRKVLSLAYSHLYVVLTVGVYASGIMYDALSFRTLPSFHKGLCLFSYWESRSFDFFIIMVLTSMSTTLFTPMSLRPLLWKIIYPIFQSTTKC